MNCYLLVGGRSSRMGRSKIDIPFAGSTFLDRVAAAAKPVFDRVIAVQRAGGEGVKSLPTIFEPVRDEQAPVFGVWRALEDARARCFILAIDYPLLTTEVLRYLAGRASHSAAAIALRVSPPRPARACCSPSRCARANSIAGRKRPRTPI